MRPKLTASAFLQLELQERAHLQEWILKNPGVIGPDVAVITSEYDKWQTATGSPVLDRLDILAIGSDGRPIVVELKRDAAPQLVHMQAINYAAMVSRLTPEDLADLYAASNSKPGTQMDREAALTFLQTQKLLTAESIRHPRIVLVASDFPASVTASVVWLNEQQVDISLIRHRAYQLDAQTVVSFSRLFPVPDVEEFTIGRRPEQPAPINNEPGEAWDEPALRRLLVQGNPSTRALLTLAAAEDAQSLGVKEIALAAGVSEASVRGQLAGLTMRLKNASYGFRQNTWPVRITYLPSGISSYSMDPELAAIWRAITSEDASASAPAGPDVPDS